MGAKSVGRWWEGVWGSEVVEEQRRRCSSEMVVVDLQKRLVGGRGPGGGRRFEAVRVGVGIVVSETLRVLGLVGAASSLGARRLGWWV